MTVLERRLMDHLLLELESVNSRFQNQLKRQHPTLTTYDLRLCTYLKSNLATKEIALLLNVTPESVKKAKHRLRKKMGILPHISWGTFLSND
ncbi:MAG: hypothetical protein HEP71_33610 [Roseivirga sp.]|nr:hypothetical protein [Roseivirga sp.]